MGNVFRPYKFNSNGVELSLNRFKLDGKIKSKALIDDSLNELDLSNHGFENLTLEFSYDILIDANDYAPENEPPFEILVVLQNPSTHTRKLVLRENLNGDGKFEISLKKEDFRGKIRVEPIIVRSREYGGNSDRFAVMRHKKIAKGSSWSVKFDERTISGTGLICKWEDFSQLDSDEISEEMLYYLDMADLDEPKLLLNQKSQQMRDIMDNRASSGKRSRIRDVLNDLVYSPAMFQLMLRSVAAVDEESFEASYVEKTLFRDMSKTLDLSNDEKTELASMLDGASNMEELGRMISLYTQRKNDIANDVKIMLDRVVNYD